MLRSFFSPPTFLLNRILLHSCEAAKNILEVINKMDGELDQDCLYFVGATAATDRLCRFIRKPATNIKPNAFDEVECLYHDALKSFPKSTLMEISKCMRSPSLNLKKTRRDKNMERRKLAIERIQKDIALALQS